MGPQKPGLVIDWGQWHGPPRMEPARGGDKAQQVADITRAAESWFAGAEAELTTVFGVAETDDEPHYLGLGRAHREVVEKAPNRFRDIPDAEGLLGHRVEWALKSLHLARDIGGIIRAGAGQPSPLGGSVISTDAINRHVDTLSRLGHRALAFLHEKAPSASGAADAAAFWPAVQRAFRFLAHLVRTSHRQKPIIYQWKLGEAGTKSAVELDNLIDLLSDVQSRYAAEKQRRSRRAFAKVDRQR